MPLATAARPGWQPRAFRAPPPTRSPRRPQAQSRPRPPPPGRTRPCKSAGPADRHETVRVRKEGHEHTCPQRLLLGRPDRRARADLLPAHHDRDHPEGREPGPAHLPERAADRRRMVRRDGDGVHAAPPRAAADLYPAPVSPVPAGPERLLVTAAHDRAATLAAAACPWRYRRRRHAGP